MHKMPEAFTFLIVYIDLGLAGISLIFLSLLFYNYKKVKSDIAAINSLENSEHFEELISERLTPSNTSNVSEYIQKERLKVNKIKTGSIVGGGGVLLICSVALTNDVVNIVIGLLKKELVMGGSILERPFFALFIMCLSSMFTSRLLEDRVISLEKKLIELKQKH